MRDVIAKAKAGTPVLGICNGFQVLCESGLLPGILMRNASLKFSCRDVSLRVDNDKTLVARQAAHVRERALERPRGHRLSANYLEI